MSISSISFTGQLISPVESSTPLIFQVGDRQLPVTTYAKLRETLQQNKIYTVTGSGCVVQDESGTRIVVDAQKITEAPYLPIVVAGYVGFVDAPQQTKNGDNVIGFSICVNDSQKRSHWYRVACFGRSADFVLAYVKKGTLLAVEGELKFGSYQDKFGVTKESVTILSNRLQFLGGKTTNAAPVADSDTIPF